jgi:hypothetical protein
MASDPTPNTGLSGTLKLVAMFAVLALATLAGLLVLEVIPRAAFTELLAKVVLLALIVALAVFAIGMLMRSGRSG